MAGAMASLVSTIFEKLDTQIAHLGRTRERLSDNLERIGYRYWEETTNPAYELFLR